MKFRLSIYLISLLVISSCGGGGGGGGGSPEPQVPSASITMSISSPQIYISQDLTINWSTSNATSCTASGDWSGTKAYQGQKLYHLLQLVKNHLLLLAKIQKEMRLLGL